jgi:hypothetical protein
VAIDGLILERAPQAYRQYEENLSINTELGMDRSQFGAFFKIVEIKMIE